ncbi:MAG TPA: cytochrome ubiquinol oxidase subunit I [Methanomicrobiales archaeon]|nr:cytochrome ubiquinol oxidase subunit I [Methanomicrobiales archaeon]
MGLSMKKVPALIIALIIYLVILLLLIIPQQGGLVSSTEGHVSAVANASYQETLPIQLVDLGSQGRSIFIAFVMILHILLANLYLGGSWVAVATESIHLRNRKPRLRRLARSVTLFNVILFSVGATFAVAGMLFFISLYPVFASEAFHIYWWPLFLEALAFGAEVFFLYGYWFSWDKIGNRWHQFLGYGFAVSVFIQTFLINTLAAGMLSPGSDQISWGSTGLLTMAPATILAWWFNATLWVLTFHRLAASVSFFGFLLAMLGMFHYLDRKDDASRTYWDLVGSYGLSWGLLGLIAQPLIGIIYMYTIFRNQVASFASIMLGGRAWEMLLMVALLSALFLSVLIYLYDRKEKVIRLPGNERLHTLFLVFLGVASACGFILVQPAITALGVNPLGYMSYKLVALFILIVIGAIVLGIDILMLRVPEMVEWGKLSPTSRQAGILAGLIGISIVAVMGFVRESARSPWLINGIIPVPGMQDYPTPIGAYQIFVVWGILITLVVVIFWFTSKVTAEHPEQAEAV